MANSKYYDTAAVIQVIGCSMKDPSLLEDDGKYFYNENDFYNEFHKVVFGCINNLYQMGTKNIRIQDVENYLATREDSRVIYNASKGSEWLLNAADNADLANFDYYYNRMKKMTLLRGYESCGLNMKFLYDPDEIFNEKKKRNQEDYLDNLTLNDIADLIDKRIEDIKSTYIDNATDDSVLLGDKIDEILSDIAKSPMIGSPLYGKYINTLHRGARLGAYYIRSSATNVGKAIPNYTMIPTRDGFKRVDEIKVGDYLIGKNGQPTKVLATYPQQEKKQVYQITFSDKRTAECCEDHLWTYMYKGHNGWNYRTESLKDIIKRSRGSLLIPSGGYKYRVPLAEPVQYPERQLSIDPYIFGLMLGNGSFRYSDNNKAFSFSSSDEELPKAIADYYGINYKKDSKCNYNYTFGDTGYNIWVEDVLKDCPELWQAKSEDKFIPNEYLIGSFEQRMSLLQGLMDTNGSISVRGLTDFATVSPKLRDNVIELCHSLGMTANYSIDKRPEKYTTGECYLVRIQCKKSLKPRLFRLQRKIDVATFYINSNKRAEHEDYIAIIDIKPLDKYEDMTCFTVAAEDHLFLMNDYIVTHNTRTMIADTCNIACDELYDSSKGEWVKNGLKQPALYITTEQTLAEITTMCLCFLADVDESHIKENKCTFEERERVKYATELIKRCPLYIEEMPDFTMKTVENSIKRNIRNYGTQYIFFDYIQSSVSILGEIARLSGGTKLREDNVLFLLSAKLKDIATKFNVFVMTSTQVNASYLTTEEPDQNVLRGAKSIADRADWGSILLNVTSDDLESIAPILQKTGCKQPNVKLSIYKNRASKYNRMYLWMDADRSTCRFNGLFATTYQYEPIPIADTEIYMEMEGRGE